MRTAAILAGVLWATLAVRGQQDLESVRKSLESLRGMLVASGFESLSDHFPSYELDRRLTSSAFDHDTDSMVAALYFVDEMEDTQSLGPLHLLRITREGTIARVDIDEPELDGTASGVDIGPTVLVATHLSPSAGQIAVLTLDLKLLRVLNGYGAKRLPDGSILYDGNMVHFADVHQASVHVFDPASATTAELFPAIEGPAELRLKDRRVHSLRFSKTGTVVAFALGYSENWYAGDPDFRQTVVRCERASSMWSCQERLLSVAAREFGIPLKSGSDDAAVSAIVDRELSKK